MVEEYRYLYKCLKCGEHFEAVVCPDGFNFFYPNRKCGADKSSLRKTLDDGSIFCNSEWWEL